MSVLPIITLGDPRLRLKGEPVDSFGKYLHELLDDLAHTMRAAPGVGLAAPQLGVALQACVVEVEGQLHELVNPQIVRSSGDDSDLEGCLSIPGYVAYITRRDQVWVVAQNRNGRKIKVNGKGLLSRALQHELDHLQGKLYIDYLESMDELIPVAQLHDDPRGRRAAHRGPQPRVTGAARTVFLGTGAFAVPILAALADPERGAARRHHRSPAPAGRGRPTEPPVAGWPASTHSELPARTTARPGRSPRSLELKPELVVLADYGQIVPRALLEPIPHGALNVHPSLLPRHRGATPIPAAILAGDSDTGVTLMRMDAGLDSGPVVGHGDGSVRNRDRAGARGRAGRSGGACWSRPCPWLAGRSSRRRRTNARQR